MKVYLTTAYENEPPQLKAMRRYAQLDKHKVHSLVNNPEEAALILFVENEQRLGLDADIFFTKVKNHPIRLKYRTKSFIYNRNDKPTYVMPGLYTAPNGRYADLTKQKATTYILEMNELIDDDAAIKPTILYSFMGMRSALVREKLFSMDHPNGKVVDTTGFTVFSPEIHTPEFVKKRKEEYVELLMQSKFVLCPRGYGTSSYRLYETMRVGRVPVILSDNWVPPEGPNWHDFAVFIKERNIKKLESILVDLEPTWEERGKKAREAWETYFAPDVKFHYMVEQCRQLLEVSQGKEKFFQSQVTIPDIYVWIRVSKLGKIAESVKPLIRRLYRFSSS